MTSTGSTWWVGDSTPSRRFPLYTRGNAGEVFPNVVTPLTGALFADASVRAQTQLFRDMGVMVERDLDDGVVALSGVFGGYLYLNLAYGRVVAERAVGMKAADADEQLFGTSSAPPYRRAPGDRSPVATMRMAWSTLREFVRPDVEVADRAHREALEWVASLPDVATADDARLLALVATFPGRLTRRFESLLRATTPAATSRALMDRLLRRSLGDGTEAMLNRLTSGVGSVDSAALATRLWALGRLVAAEIELTTCFDVGLDGLFERVATSDSAAAREFTTAFHDFLAEHGHRCADEYELAHPNWAMDPRMALAAIDRLRLAPAARAPELAAARLSADRQLAAEEALAAIPRVTRAAFRHSLHLATIGSPARERAKDAFVRELGGMRAVLHELARRAAERGGMSIDACFLVTAEELPGYVADPAAFAHVVAARAEQRAFLAEREPPFWFEGEIPDPHTWPLRRPAAAMTTDTVDLRGIGVCGGTASGRARVILDPSDPSALEPGDVLVARFTDPAWTPLFLAAVAVVVDVGAVQSHAAIVSRELGIPAVVSVTDASRLIPDGAWVTVNGDTGQVSVAPAAS